MSVTAEQAAIWFENRAKVTPMPGARTMFETAAAALREKANGMTTKRWIPVTERLPDDGETVLVCGNRGGIYTAYQNHGCWHKLNSKSHYCNPTHWMPLPERPEEQRKENEE